MNLTEDDTYSSIEKDLAIAIDTFHVTILVFIMTATGCDTTLTALWGFIRRPIGIIVGMASQFCFLPFCTFCITRIMKFAPYESLSLLIQSCCPGGAISNLYTIMFNGNVSLSICMTTISTLLALGMMPLNLFLYTYDWDGEDIQIPYVNIAITLVMILIPCLIGMVIKYKWPKLAPWIKRIGSISGLLAILLSVIIQVFLIPGLFEMSWKLYIATTFLPFFGLNFGFIWARIFKLNYKDSRTIAIETGFQNTALALTITYLSFPFERQKEMAPIQLVFAISACIEALIACLLYHLWHRLKPQASVNENTGKKIVKKIMLNENAEESSVHLNGKRELELEDQC